jgi:outer membrane receptor protein involved in Fe transport
VNALDDQGTRVQPTLDIRGYSISPVVGNPQGVSVFLDGVRINEPDAQELDFDLVPMDAVDHAELVRGPAALFGKNSLAGALILSTARGNTPPTLEGAVEAGAFGYRNARVTASGMWKGFDGYVLARGSEENGYRDDTPARTRMLFTTVGRKRDRDDIALSMLAAHDRIFQAGSLPESWLSVDRRANFTLGDYFAPDLIHVALRGTAPLLGGQLRGNLFARRNDRDQFNVNVAAPSVRARTDNRSLGGTTEITIPTRLGSRPLAFTIGAEYTRNDVRYRIFQEATPDAGVDATCEPITSLCEKAQVIEDNAAFYSQAALEVSESLAITASARGDYVRIPFRDLRDSANDGTNTFSRISPQLGATYHVRNVFRSYVSVSGGFRAPAALELACADREAPCPLPFALGDDPPLAPVTVWNYEAGLDWKPISWLALGLVGFRTEARDEIVFVASQTAAGYFQNIARTRRQGTEISATLALPAGLHASASYAYVDATYRSAAQLASALPDAEPVQPGDRFPLVPPHRVTARAGMTHLVGAFLVDGELSARAVSTQFVRGDEANRFAPLSGYVITGLRLTVDYARVSATFRVDNLFGERYTTFGVYGANPLGPPGGPPPAVRTVERFLTPGYPRTATIGLALRR